MATFDVDDVLDDPDFQDEFQVVRQDETVDTTTGRSIDTPESGEKVVGIVQPASGSTLQLMPDLARTAGVIEIWTRYNLQGETDTTAPDIVLWNGKHYTVSHTDPWTNWGDGYTHAVCVRREQTGGSTPL